MTREWQPGDVAVDGGGNRLMCAERADGSLVWMNIFGGCYPIHGLIDDTRALAVIDPESREDVERLVACVYEQPFKARIIDQWAAALREYAEPTPPKPEEPLGLGAVAEDDEGNTWTRADKGTLPWFLTAQDGNGGRCSWDRWDRIAAVRVLSEGVKAGEDA